MHWIGAEFCVCMFLDSIDKLFKTFQKVSKFHLQNFRGLRVQIVCNGEQRGKRWEGGGCSFQRNFSQFEFRF